MIDTMKKFGLFIYFVLLSIGIHATPMEFKSVSMGGNCDGCSWVSAMGDITKDTPSQLENFLKQSIYHDRIVFHSGGGNLWAGLKMGELLRRYNIKVGIGKTVVDTYSSDSEYKYYTTEEGYCYSSCAYAFLGGIARVVDSGKLGFHQFYDSSAMRDFSYTQFDGYDRMEDQKITGDIVKYLKSMKIDMDLYPLIVNKEPEDMYILSQDDLYKYDIIDAVYNKNGTRTKYRTTTNWNLVPYGQGLVAEIKTHENKVRIARLYGTRNNKYYLTVFVPNDYYGNNHPLYSRINSTFDMYRNLAFLVKNKKSGKSKDYKILELKTYLSENRKKITLVLEIGSRAAKALAMADSISLYLQKTKSNDYYPYPARAYQDIFDLIKFDDISGDERLPLSALKMKI